MVTGLAGRCVLETWGRSHPGLSRTLCAFSPPFGLSLLLLPPRGGAWWLPKAFGCAPLTRPPAAFWRVLATPTVLFLGDPRSPWGLRPPHPSPSRPPPSRAPSPGPRAGCALGGGGGSPRTWRRAKRRVPWAPSDGARARQTRRRTLHRARSSLPNRLKVLGLVGINLFFFFPFFFLGGGINLGNWFFCTQGGWA